MVRFRPRPHAAAVGGLVAALLLALAGCGGGGGSTATGGSEAIGSLHRSGTSPLQVVTAQGQTLALAPVTIGGTGPFPFIVDTGASRSVVDRRVADRLGLHGAGQSDQVSGVGCTSKAAEATVASWQVGGVALPKTTVNVLDMAADQGGQVSGLLGSDVLSRFGIIAIDYQAERLRLGSGAVELSAGAARTISVRVVEAQGAVLAVAPVRVQHHGPYSFVVDSGAAGSVIDRGLAKKLHLSVTSHGRAAGVACQTTTETVQIAQWQAGSVPLPATGLTSIDLPGSRKGKGLQGLLGSNTLSTFGSVALDYVHQRLLLADRTASRTG